MREFDTIEKHKEVELLKIEETKGDHTNTDQIVKKSVPAEIGIKEEPDSSKETVTLPITAGQRENIHNWMKVYP